MSENQIQAPEPYPLKVGPGPDWHRWMRERTRRVRRHSASDLVLEALVQAGCEAEAKRCRVCGRVFAEFSEREAVREPTGRLIQLRCHSRMCPACHRAWMAKQIDKVQRYEAQRPKVAYTCLMTFTIGSTVRPWDLVDRYRSFRPCWRRLRRKLKRHGLRGGYYAFEVVIKDGLFHLHLHVYARFHSDEARWLELDSRWCLTRARETWMMSPAWLQLMSWWEECIEKEAPDLWRRLPWTGVEESDEERGCWSPWQLRAIRRFLARGFITTAPRRFVSCDIGGRKPGDPGQAHREQARWLPLETVTADPKEALKYACKPQHDEPGRLNYEDAQALAHVIRLFKGHRRVQSFGDLYGDLGVGDIIDEEREAQEALTVEAGFTNRYCIPILPEDDMRTWHHLVEGIRATDAWRVRNRLDCLDVEVRPALPDWAERHRYDGLCLWWEYGITPPKGGRGEGTKRGSARDEAGRRVDADTGGAEAGSKAVLQCALPGL